MPPCVSVSGSVCAEWQAQIMQADGEEEEDEEEEEAKTRREEADEEEVVCERATQSSRVRLKEEVSVASPVLFVLDAPRFWSSG